MKYVALAAIVILFVRIDFILDLVDRTYQKYADGAPAAEVDGTRASRETYPVKDDRVLRRTPRDNFLGLLDDFHAAPTPELRNQAIGLLRANPKLFGAKLDRDLEAHVFRWRDLLINNRPEVVNMVLELGQLLQGENLELLNRFFALWMDIQMEHFIAAYVRTKDVNCVIAPVFGDAIPEEEKLFEYYDREEALKAFLAREKIDPAQKQLAANCLLQLGLVIQKLAPAPAGPGAPGAEAGDSAAEPAPEAAPAAPAEPSTTPAPGATP